MKYLASICALVTVGLATLGCGDSGKTSAGSGGGGGMAGSGSGGGPGSTKFFFPQFIGGKAFVDTTAFTSIPLVVATTGEMPDKVEVIVGDTPFTATKTSAGFVATVPSSALVVGHGEGSVPVSAKLSIGNLEVGSGPAVGIYVGSGSKQFTEFAAVGPAYGSSLFNNVPLDALEYSWISVAGGTHQLWHNELDGSLRRLHPDDVALGDPKDEPLDGHAVYSSDRIGVVYRTQKPNDGHWLVKLRVVDQGGTPLVDTIDLTQGEAAFTPTQAGVDPGGFSGAWLHISPPNPNPPPVEVRFSRWDTAHKKLIGPITLDQDQPDVSTDGQGPQAIEPLGEIGIACSSTICVVTYTRDVYNGLVDLNIPKLFVAVVDLANGKQIGKAKAIEASDWDTQLFGHSLIALSDGTFQIVYTANDTAAAVNPKSPCDNMLERDLLFAVKLDTQGNVVGAPKPIFDNQGSREYPRIASHPDGFALFWEDQRSECSSDGHIRMAFDVTDPTLSKLLDPYLEVPGSIGLPPEDPALAVVGTNFVVAWSDDRHGNGLADPKPELFLDTYWR